MSGDGTSRGLRPSPIPRNATSTMKMASGTRKRVMEWRAGNLTDSRLAHARNFFAPGGDGRFTASRCDTVAAVAEREETAERHDDATTPDPDHERLVINAHAPGAAGHRFAERHVEIAEDTGVNRCLGHRHLLRIVDALFGMQHLDVPAVAADVRS